MYWTSTGHMWELLAGSILVALGLLAGYTGGAPAIDMSSMRDWHGTKPGKLKVKKSWHAKRAKDTIRKLKAYGL
jgi:hypothetical protein